MNLPIRKKPAKTQALHRLVFILVSENQVLVKKEEQGNVMADLWQFPFIESLDLKRGEAVISSKFGKVIEYLGDLPVIKHGFTRYQAYLYPHIWSCDKLVSSIKGYHWHLVDHLDQLPFSAGHRKLAQKLKKTLINYS